MRYFKIRAYTAYCGEEITEYYEAHNWDEAEDYGETLMFDNAENWFHAHEDEYGPEDTCPWEMWVEDCGYEVEEITKEEFDENVG